MTTDFETSDAAPSVSRAAPPAPRLGFRMPPRPRPDCCLNCAAPATGRFCAECGQEIKDHSVSLGPLLADGLAELASWDSKLLRTLVPLLIRPGFLTNEYNAGRRVPYLSPLKLYLTLSVLFFLLLSWAHPSARFIHIKPGSVTFGTGGEKSSAAKPAAQPASARSVFERAMERGARKANQSPAMFVAALIDDIPKMMFFLLPLFAVTLKLLYLRTKRFYAEHLIFLLHVHALAFLVLTPLLLLHPDWLIGTVALALWVYLLAALRAVYKQSWSKTFFKMQVILVSYVLLLLLCVTAAMLVALWLL